VSDKTDALPPSGMSPAVRMWGAIVVSIATVVGFIAVVIVALCVPLPPGSEGIASNLVAILGTLTTGVVGYWIGSSSGSAAKDGKK